MTTTTATKLTLAELQNKYKAVLDSAKTFNIASFEAREMDGRLVMKGEAPYQMEKNLFWDKLKTIPTWKDEVKADITVKNKDIYGLHTVVAGETLSKLAERHLGDAKRFMEIFELNKDMLSDPNMIKVGQKLKLPVKA